MQSNFLAMAQACTVAIGHFDELRTRPQISTNLQTDVNANRLINSWAQFFKQLPSTGEFNLKQRSINLERQLGGKSVAYKLSADEAPTERPRSLDLFPLIIEPDCWQQIETGILQRISLLEQVMADVYGPQQLLAQGLLPPALVQGHPGYLRALHNVTPAGGTHLHIAAFDLARGSDGHWRVLSQHYQAPSGLGYLLENRQAISSQFPEAFQAMHVQGLADTYQAWMDNLKQISPAGTDSHLALLTPGPYNETYAEHAYLARYLGLSLVEGRDLTVRDERLYLKTHKGLVQVHGLLKWVDDEYLDPLELRPDSALGVPGLLQAIRAGNVLMANAPGAAFLESPALLGCLPALSRHLLGEDLRLPSLPTWWCGERLAMKEALPRIRDCVIKASYPASSNLGGFESVMGSTLSARELDEWMERIVQHSEEHTLQAYMPLSQMPTWRTPQQDTQNNDANTPAGQVVARSVMLRVFAVSDGAQSWRVLPGGLAQVAGAEADLASMRRNGSSADVWALSNDKVAPTTSLQRQLTPAPLVQCKPLVTRRAAENLYWMGRYTERAENSIRLASLTLARLNDEEPSSISLLAWLSSMAVSNTLVLPGVPSAIQARHIFERALISSLGNTAGATSIGYYLRALKMTGSSIRERLSPEHWCAIVRAEDELFSSCTSHVSHGDDSALAALQVLKSTGKHMTAIAGEQADRMTRDDGWRLLSIGRHLERLTFLASALLRGLETGSIHTNDGFKALISLFGRSITAPMKRAQNDDLATLIDSLVLDGSHPNSLAWVTHTLRDQLEELASRDPHQLHALSLQVPDLAAWSLPQLCEARPIGSPLDNAPGYFFALNDLLLQCQAAAFHVSNAINAAYFSHTGERIESAGTS